MRITILNGEPDSLSGFDNFLHKVAHGWLPLATP